MKFAAVFKFNPNHDSKGQFATGGMGNSDFNEMDRKLVDYKPGTRPLTGPNEDLRTLSGLLPDSTYVPYSQVPFFDQMQAMQGTPDPNEVSGIDNKLARDKLFAEQPVETVRMSDLILTQNVVSQPELDQFDQPLDPSRSGFGPVAVVRYDGKLYLMDGHHRLVHDMLDGKKTIKAHILDIEKKKVSKIAAAFRALKFNANHDQIGRFTFADGSAGYFPGAKGANKQAKQLLGSVTPIEPNVTQWMREAANAAGGDMAGLEHRLKSEGSLTRKIHDTAKFERRPVAAVAVEINDAIRYSMVFPDSTYRASYEQANQRLIDHGLTLVKHKDNWNPNTTERNDFIRGITNTYRDVAGHLIQVIFHTSDSLALKEHNDSLYQQSRLFTTDAETRRKLEEMMRNNAKHVTIHP